MDTLGSFFEEYWWAAAIVLVYSVCIGIAFWIAFRNEFKPCFDWSAIDRSLAEKPIKKEVVYDVTLSGVSRGSIFTYADQCILRYRDERNGLDRKEEILIIDRDDFALRAIFKYGVLLDHISVDGYNMGSADIPEEAHHALHMLLLRLRAPMKV